MGKRIMLDIGDNMSREEELAILDKLVDVFTAHPNNYLASLFTVDLRNWTANQVKVDFPPNVMESMEALIEESMSSGEELSKLKRELEYYRKKAADLDSTRGELASVREELERVLRDAVLIRQELQRTKAQNVQVEEAYGFFLGR